MKIAFSPFSQCEPNMNQPLLDQEQWLERHRPYLTLLAHAHLNRRYSARLDTSDIVQQTLLNAFLKRDEFRGSTEAELAAWLREILKNKLADALRDRQRDKRDVRRECSFDEGIDASFSRTEGWLVVCFSCDDGKQLWSKDFDKEYGVARQTWGFCDYPLVDGDVLICVPGGSEATVVALNRHTGNEVWRRVLVPAKTSTRPLRSAHTATMRGSMQGFDYYVVGTDQAIYFINRTDGRLLASYEEFHPATAFSHTPLFDNSDLIVTNGYKGGVARLAISLEGQVMSLKEIFRGRQSLDAFEDSGILVDARPACIYLCRWTTLHFFYRWQGHFDRCEFERSIVASLVSIA